MPREEVLADQENLTLLDVRRAGAYEASRSVIGPYPVRIRLVSLLPMARGPQARLDEASTFTVASRKRWLIVTRLRDPIRLPVYMTGSFGWLVSEIAMI